MRVLMLVLAVTATASAQGLPTDTVPHDILPNDRNAVSHALNRLTWGIRPGDVDRVRERGLGRWVDDQLQPSRIDDTALAARLPGAMPVPASFATPQDARRWGREDAQRLAAEKLLRALHSERQLEEVLVDFWFNHFNVYAGKGRTAIYLRSYERDAIRPHVLGRFRDLLGATAKSPAMLFYLDNWQSGRPSRDGGGTLNENYARELLELHTLGVDGGYSQQDVTEVARIFTGWSIDPRDHSFRFTARFHDRAGKTVLGQTITPGGIGEGEQLLDLVARHPSTARHIARKLAQRFVGDEPSEALVARAAAKFRDTDGDLREVVRTIVASPEFFAPAACQAKFKTPLEFVTSALRATSVDAAPRPMLRTLQQLGMPLYMCQPPTGYSDEADAWVSSGGLVGRMNAAIAIARLKPGLDALTLGSPEFQKQ